MTKIQIATDYSEQPILYAQGAKKSDILQWKTWTKGPEVYFEHGKVGMKQIVTKYKAEAVNIGKANFRDPIAQAKFESEASWARKIKEGYYVTAEEAKTAEVIRPMKAHRMDKQGHKLRYPCSAQKKYNGYRCLAICTDPGYVLLMSNGGETWNVPHIATYLASFMEVGDMLDGELYIHGVSLQNIGSLVKKNRPESRALQFHVYDMPKKAGKLYPWRERLEQLESLFERLHLRSDLLTRTIVLADTVTINNEQELNAFNETAIFGGYEGVMLRNLDGTYRFNYRSYDIFKLKAFKDEEFKVIAITSRVNSINGVDTLIADYCVCEANTDSTKTFKVVPKGDLAMKESYWANRDTLIGTMINVRYLELSDGGLPQGNPVGTFRLSEDIGGEDDDNENWVS